VCGSLQAHRALRPGRNPWEQSRKSASNSRFKGITTAIWTPCLFSVGIPNGLFTFRLWNPRVFYRRWAIGFLLRSSSISSKTLSRFGLVNRSSAFIHRLQELFAFANVFPCRLQHVFPVDQSNDFRRNRFILCFFDVASFNSCGIRQELQLNRFGFNRLWSWDQWI